ncbi:hypothetical protein [Anaerosporobacter sp.]
MLNKRIIKKYLKNNAIEHTIKNNVIIINNGLLHLKEQLNNIELCYFYYSYERETDELQLTMINKNYQLKKFDEIIKLLLTVRNIIKVDKYY